MAIFKGRVRVRYGYSRWGYTRNNGKGWHGGSDEEGLDSTTIRMPDYKGKSISGRVITARKVDRSMGSKTWEWGWYVCVELDAGQTPDAVNYLYFCHNARNLVSVGQRVKSGDALAVMGNTGNAALASPPFAHCHFEVRATTTGAGLDPTEYTGHPNAVGTYGTAINGMEDDGMKFLKVTSGKCEVFTAPDVNAVDKSYNGGKLIEGTCCALPGFVDSKNEEKTERNAGYLVVSHSGGGMLRQGTRKGIRRTPANRGMRAHWVVKGLDISEDVCHGMCP